MVSSWTLVLNRHRVFAENFRSISLVFTLLARVTEFQLELGPPATGLQKKRSNQIIFERRAGLIAIKRKRLFVVRPPRWLLLLSPSPSSSSSSPSSPPDLRDDVDGMPRFHWSAPSTPAGASAGGHKQSTHTHTHIHTHTHKMAVATPLEWWIAGSADDDDDDDAVCKWAGDTGAPGKRLICIRCARLLRESGATQSAKRGSVPYFACSFVFSPLFHIFRYETTTTTMT